MYTITFVIVICFYAVLPDTLKSKLKTALQVGCIILILYNAEDVIKHKSRR